MKSLHEHDSALEILFKAGVRVSYSKGETIIRPEDTPQGVFLIESGFVKSFDITKYGEENLLVLRQAGQMFPVLWTMTDERTEVFYQAMSDIVMYRLDRDVYLDRLENDPRFTKAVLQQVLTMYEIHSQRVINLEYRTAPERIAYRIVRLADRFGEKSTEGVKVLAPVRRQDIAESVNCSRETASRELAKLQKKGLIATVDSHLVITNIKGLMDIVGVQDSMRRKFKRFE